jgi:hypothetical protein
MNNNADSEFWIPDIETYNHLQKLKKFVDFVANLEYSTAENKTKAEEIKLLIENIDKPDSFIKEWCVCLNIFDPVIQSRKGNGVFWREWCVYLESGFLEAESAIHSTDENGSIDDEFFYSGIIYFKKGIKGERIYMDTDIDEFIADAMNYRSYVTEALNDIEVVIDVWSKVKHQPVSESVDPVKYSVKINLGNKDMIEPWAR